MSFSILIYYLKKKREKLKENYNNMIRLYNKSIKMMSLLFISDTSVNLYKTNVYSNKFFLLFFFYKFKRTLEAWREYKLFII